MPLLLFYMILLLISLHMFVYYIEKETHRLIIFLYGIFAGFSTYGPITLLGVMGMEFTPKNLAGTSHGIVTLAANIGAICAGLPFSILSKMYSWNAGFASMQLFVIFSLIILFITRNFNSKFEIEKA